VITPSTELHCQLEKLAFRTWPAASNFVAGASGWILRASGGVTKRANSVWTSTGGPLPAGDWLDEAERFYAERGLPSIFQISDASPDGLECLLEAKGYQIDSPCLVMIAQTEEVLQRTSPADGHACRVTVLSEPDEHWIDNFIRMEGFTEARRPFYRKLFADIEPAKCFISLEKAGRCAAVGTAVAEDGWSGFLNVVVDPEQRGQGVGKMLIHALAKWSLEQSANGLYLQVVTDNEPAVRLYQGAGYAPLYRFHYRIKNI
jgi:GNAT superfamily N-acetyltransferase